MLYDMMLFTNYHCVMSDFNRSLISEKKAPY